MSDYQNDPQNVAESKPTMLSNDVYDKVKFLAVVVLPAFGTLYFALAQTWGLPNAEEVVGTIVAIDAFLGMVLQISNAKYNNSDQRFDGSIRVSPSADGETSNLNVSLDPTSVATKKEITVKIKRD